MTTSPVGSSSNKYHDDANNIITKRGVMPVSKAETDAWLMQVDRVTTAISDFLNEKDEGGSSAIVSAQLDNKKEYVTSEIEVEAENDAIREMKLEKKQQGTSSLLSEAEVQDKGVKHRSDELDHKVGSSFLDGGSKKTAAERHALRAKQLLSIAASRRMKRYNVETYNCFEDDDEENDNVTGKEKKRVGSDTSEEQLSEFEKISLEQAQRLKKEGNELVVNAQKRQHYNNNNTEGCKQSQIGRSSDNTSSGASSYGGDTEAEGVGGFTGAYEKYCVALNLALPLARLIVKPYDPTSNGNGLASSSSTSTSAVPSLIQTAVATDPLLKGTVIPLIIACHNNAALCCVKLGRWKAAWQHATAALGEDWEFDATASSSSSCYSHTYNGWGERYNAKARLRRAQAGVELVVSAIGVTELEKVADGNVRDGGRMAEGPMPMTTAFHPRRFFLQCATHDVGVCLRTDPHNTEAMEMSRRVEAARVGCDSFEAAFAEFGLLREGGDDSTTIRSDPETSRKNRGENGGSHEHDVDHIGDQSRGQSIFDLFFHPVSSSTPFSTKKKIEKKFRSVTENGGDGDGNGESAVNDTQVTVVANAKDQRYGNMIRTGGFSNGQKIKNDILFSPLLLGSEHSQRVSCLRLQHLNYIDGSGDADCDACDEDYNDICDTTTSRRGVDGLLFSSVERELCRVVHNLIFNITSNKPAAAAKYTATCAGAKILPPLSYSSPQSAILSSLQHHVYPNLRRLHRILWQCCVAPSNTDGTIVDPHGGGTLERILFSDISCIAGEDEMSGGALEQGSSSSSSRHDDGEKEVEKGSPKRKKKTLALKYSSKAKDGLMRLLRGVGTDNNTRHVPKNVGVVDGPKRGKSCGDKSSRHVQFLEACYVCLDLLLQCATESHGKKEDDITSTTCADADSQRQDIHSVAQAVALLERFLHHRCHENNVERAKEEDDANKHERINGTEVSSLRRYINLSKGYIASVLTVLYSPSCRSNSDGADGTPHHSPPHTSRDPTNKEHDEREVDDRSRSDAHLRGQASSFASILTRHAMMNLRNGSPSAPLSFEGSPNDESGGDGELCSSAFITDVTALRCLGALCFSKHGQGQECATSEFTHRLSRWAASGTCDDCERSREYHTNRKTKELKITGTYNSDRQQSSRHLLQHTLRESTLLDVFSAMLIRMGRGGWRAGAPLQPETNGSANKGSGGEEQQQHYEYRNRMQHLLRLLSVSSSTAATTSSLEGQISASRTAGEAEGMLKSGKKISRLVKEARAELRGNAVAALMHLCNTTAHSASITGIVPGSATTGSDASYPSAQHPLPLLEVCSEVDAIPTLVDVLVVEMMLPVFCYDGGMVESKMPPIQYRTVEGVLALLHNLTVLEKNATASASSADTSAAAQDKSKPASKDSTTKKVIIRELVLPRRRLARDSQKNDSPSIKDMALLEHGGDQDQTTIVHVLVSFIQQVLAKIASGSGCCIPPSCSSASSSSSSIHYSSENHQTKRRSFEKDDDVDVDERHNDETTTCSSQLAVVVRILGLLNRLFNPTATASPTTTPLSGSAGGDDSSAALEQVFNTIVSSHMNLWVSTLGWLLWLMCGHHEQAKKKQAALQLFSVTSHTKKDPIVASSTTTSKGDNACYDDDDDDCSHLQSGVDKVVKLIASVLVYFNHCSCNKNDTTAATSSSVESTFSAFSLASIDYLVQALNALILIMVGGQKGEADGKEEINGYVKDVICCGSTSPPATATAATSSSGRSVSLLPPSLSSGIVSRAFQGKKNSTVSGGSSAAVATTAQGSTSMSDTATTNTVIPLIAGNAATALGALAAMVKRKQTAVLQQQAAAATADNSGSDDSDSNQQQKMNIFYTILNHSMHSHCDVAGMLKVLTSSRSLCDDLQHRLGGKYCGGDGRSAAQRQRGSLEKNSTDDILRQISNWTSMQRNIAVALGKLAALPLPSTQTQSVQSLVADHKAHAATAAAKTKPSRTMNKNNSAITEEEEQEEEQGLEYHRLVSSFLVKQRNQEAVSHHQVMSSSMLERLRQHRGIEILHAVMQGKRF